MIINNGLSLTQQRYGRKNYMLFNLFNGASYICTADNILILFALASGAPAYFTVILTSFVYISGIGMLLGKNTIYRYGAAKSLGIYWLLRYAGALLMAASAFFLPYSHFSGMTILTIGAGLYFLFTAAGVTSIQPIYGEITRPENRGKFIAAIFLYFNIVCLAALFILAIVMRHAKTLTVYQGIMTFGAICGFISAFFAFRIKESPLPQLSARQSLKNSVITTLSNENSRKLLYAQCAALCGIAMTVPVSLIAMKEGYKITDDAALLYVIVYFSGGIAISFLSRTIMGHTGPRPIILLDFSILILVNILWIFSPITHLWYYSFFIFFLNGIASMGLSMALNHYFLNATPEKKRVGAGLFIAIIAGGCAGFAGAIISSLMIKTIPWFGWHALDLYKVYFVVNLCFMALLLGILCKLKKLKDWELTKVIGLVLTPRDLRTLYFVNSLDSFDTTPVHEDSNLTKLTELRSDLTEGALLEYLNSPKLWLRRKAIAALGEIDFGPPTAEILMQHLKYGIYSTADLAARILGEHGCREAIPLLRENLHSDDVYLKAESMPALVNLEDYASYPAITEIFLNTADPRLTVYGTDALEKIGNQQALAVLLRKTLSPQITSYAQEEILASIAQLCGIGTEYYCYLKQDKRNPEDGEVNLRDLFETIGSSDLPEFVSGIKTMVREKLPSKTILDEIGAAVKRYNIPIPEAVANFLVATPPPEQLPDNLFYCIIGIVLKNYSTGRR